MKIPLTQFRLLWPSILCSLSLSMVSVSFAYGQQRSGESINMKALESLQAEIRMSAGTLELTSQREPEASMRFIHTRDAWEPVVLMESASGLGRLSITQPEGKGISLKEEDENSWEIQLPESIPTDLKVRMGAGEGMLDFSGAKLDKLRMDAGAGEFQVNLANSSVSDLEINAGVGSLRLDLRGKRIHNLHASINGGIGDVELLLPQDVGVRVKVNGLGGLESEGFRKVDGYYVNEAYGKTPYSIDIKVNGGLGSLEMNLYTAAH